eukprot:gene19579-biopygen17669
MVAGPTYAGVLISDDGGETFRPSRDSIVTGGEGTCAPAPNGSLILNTRATQNLRFQSKSDDAGETWSAPVVLSGFGSNGEGALIRVGGVLLFSHPGNIGGRANRWNLTVWASLDSAASWDPLMQVEPDTDISLHTAYSTLVAINDTTALVVWERGPMGRCVPTYPNCYPVAGEYQTIRVREVPLPTV